MLYGNEQQQKDKTEVEVTFVNGSTMRGHFYVAPAQRVADVLNDTRSFLPFEDIANTVRLLNKANIMDVKPAHQQGGGRRQGISIA